MLTKGTCFNISLNGKRPLWGYFLLVTDQGEEFIIKRNSKIPFDRYRKVYQTSYSFKDQIFSKKAPANVSSLIGVPLGLLLARTYRKILPMDLFFGKANLDLNVREGAINVLLFLFAVMITLWLVTIARYVQLKWFVEKNEAELVFVGQIKPTEYRQLFALVCLSSIVLFLAYFVQMRLFLGLILYLLVVLFYRGLEFTEPREIEFDFKKDPK